MLVTLALLYLAQSSQDPEAIYRDALYQEVDKGDLDKAIELYRKAEEDGSAGLSVRAKSAFRRAWCLEKKGNKVEAERAYRDLQKTYPDQSDVIAKARERLDKLVSGNGGPTVTVSMDDRIAAWILELGGDEKTRAAARRSLVLVGEASLPALRKALSHKDVTLSATAAAALVEMEQDGGTYAPLMRGLVSDLGTWWTGPNVRWDCRTALAKLLKRQPGYAKDFAEAVRKEKETHALEAYLHVLRNHDMPDLGDRIRDLLVEGDLSLASDLLGVLRITDEKEFLDLLRRFTKVEDGSRRACALLRSRSFKVSDTVAFSKLMAEFFGKADEESISRAMIDLTGSSSSEYNSKNLFYRLELFAPTKDLMEQLAPSWIAADSWNPVDVILRNLPFLGGDGLRLTCKLLGLSIEDGRKVVLIDHLRLHGAEETVPEVRAEVEKTLWKFASSGKTTLKAAALKGLLGVVSEKQAQWDDLVRAVIVQSAADPTPRDTDEGPAEHLDKWFKSASEDGKKRFQSIVSHLLANGETKVRSFCVQIARSIGGDSVLESLCKLAEDKSQPVRLREDAVCASASIGNQVKARPTLTRLVKDPEAVVRRAAAFELSSHWAHEVDETLAPLVDDPDPDPRRVAVRHFTADPRVEFLDPVVRALKLPEHRLEAARALARTESMKAVPHLITLLEDESPDIRNTARNGLEAIKKHYDEVQRWKDWYEGVKK